MTREGHVGRVKEAITRQEEVKQGVTAATADILPYTGVQFLHPIAKVSVREFSCNF